jgi:hypothetical protein
VKRLALSLKQPWAALLVSGRKSIEIRRWRTVFRGPLLIHAARVDDDRPQAWDLVPPELRPLAERRRGIIGEGELYECRDYADRAAFAADVALHRNEADWFEEAGLYGFCFRGLRELPFVEVPGFVRLFEVDWEEAVSLDPGSPTPPVSIGVAGVEALRDPGETPPASVRGRLEKLMKRKSS